MTRIIPRRSWKALFLLLLSISIPILHADAKTIPKEEQKAFHALVKAIQKENGGYVHPSIGLIAPAPSGAPRGIAIVKKIKPTLEHDVLIKVPWSYQMSRELALQTLQVGNKVIPMDAPDLSELDDAALLVLLLVQEYGLGPQSKFHAYIQTLPQKEGSIGCGWSDLEDFRDLPPGVDMDDLETAKGYVHRVTHGLAKDYGQYLANAHWPQEWNNDPVRAIAWALCIVSSRATAANAMPGDNARSGVRLVPLADLANHRKSSGGFTELSGNERIAKGDFMDVDPSDAGAFVVRATWKCGTSRDLSVGDEITVNYNLSDYSAVDWFLSLGFVPYELQSPEQRQHDEF